MKKIPRAWLAPVPNLVLKMRPSLQIPSSISDTIELTFNFYRFLSIFDFIGLYIRFRSASENFIEFVTRTRTRTRTRVQTRRFFTPPETSTASEGTMPNIASENRPENPEPQTTESGAPSQLITPNITTENRFLPLQDGKESDTPFNRLREICDLGINPSNNSPKARDTPPTPAVVNKCCFPVRF